MAATFEFSWSTDVRHLPQGTALQSRSRLALDFDVRALNASVLPILGGEMTAGTVYGMPLEPTELTTPGTTYLLRQSALPQGPEAYLRLLALRNLLEDPLSVSDLQHCLKLLVGFSMEDYGARAHESQQAKTGLAIWVVAAALSPLLVLAATIIAVPEGVIGAKSVASFFLFAVGGAGVAALGLRQVWGYLRLW